MGCSSKMSKRILLLNGPPRSGKDTIGEMLCDFLGLDGLLEKFAAPIKHSIPHIYRLDRYEWANVMDSTRFKDEPDERLLGKTPREVQIALSESYLKPLHGKDVFGQMLLNRLKVCVTDNIIISDSGFKEEAEVLVKYYGAENVRLWRIYRDGCDFGNDSRSYIDLSEHSVDTLEVHNNTSLRDLRAFVESLYVRT